MTFVFVVYQTLICAAQVGIEHVQFLSIYSKRAKKHLRYGFPI